MFTYTEKTTFVNEEKELAKALLIAAINGKPEALHTPPDYLKDAAITCMELAEIFLDTWEERNPTEVETTDKP
jgi:hypothetical protein